MRKSPLRDLLIPCVLCTFSLPSHANIEVVLDGYAYQLNSDVVYNFIDRTVTIDDSAVINCLQADGSIPLNNAGNFTLLTNNQAIGLIHFSYWIDAGLLYLTSESSDLVCENGVFVDQIFGNGFEVPFNPIIFANGFE